MCQKTPKRETEVLRDPFDPLNLPPGRDWSAAPVTFDYPGSREALADYAKADADLTAALSQRLSAPPRASWWHHVGLAGSALWSRLCKRHGASCAILVATFVLVGVGAALAGVDSLLAAMRG